LDTAKASGQAIDPRSLQFVEQAIQAYQKVLELKPSPGQLENIDVDLANLALGNAYRQKGQILLFQRDVDSALSAFDESIRFIGLAQKAFEASVPAHESYRRYLTQTHEYLGTVYQWQGNAFESKLDYDQALPAYQKSMDAYTQCVSQGENSPDLIIQNDIVKKYCQPKFEEVKKIHDDLVGGQ
jgi:tetratricopeptide (TPR) repeat protein